MAKKSGISVQTKRRGLCGSLALLKSSAVEAYNGI
jgi:hypothetical protein